MWMDYGSPQKKDLTLQSYSEAVAQKGLEAYKQIVWHDHVPLGIVQKTLPLNYRTPNAERLAWAKKRVEALGDKLPTDKADIYANEAIILHEKQKAELILQAIRIGELTIATLPNEVYALTGLKLKAQSPFASHFNIELANGAEGYILTPEQHVLGGYTTWPARTAGLEVQAEPRIVQTLLSALEEATGQKRRVMRDDHIVENHGSYSSNGQWLSGVMKEVGMANCGTLHDFGNFCTKRESGDVWESKCIEEYDRYKGVEEMMPFAKGVSAKSGNFNEHGDCTDTDYGRMLAIVKATGYTGHIGIEYEGTVLSEAEGITATKVLLERTGMMIS